MKKSLLTLALLVATGALHAAPWSYRGSLNDGGKPANGPYDLRVTLLNEAKTASLSSPITLYAVQVVDGNFAVDVDFGIDLSASPVMALKTEVQQGSSGFAALGEATRFDPKAAFGGACWEVSGNAGTTSSNYLGTNDNQPLEIRTSGRRAFRLEPSTELGSNARPLTSNTIAGSVANGVISPARGATIAGGGAENNLDPNYPVGGSNRIDDHYGSIGGGLNNLVGTAGANAADAAFATVAGGRDNTASETSASVGGGLRNSAAGVSSTVSGGFNNGATGTSSSVIGGSRNTATGFSSTVSGGGLNCAGGDYSWAGGQNAKTRVGNEPGDGTCAASSGDTSGDEGSFVWADQFFNGDFLTTGPNQFLVRAAGGVGINTNTIPNGTEMVIQALDNSVGFNLRSVSGKEANFALFDTTGTLSLNTSPIAGQNRIIVVGGSGGAASLSNGGTWTNASSRSYKENFNAVNGLDVLSRLVKMPIMTWDYKGSSEGLHMGPVAEDFKATFGLAGDGKSISTVDADGIALAAIQGLNAKLESENAAQRAQLDVLRARLDALEARN